MMMKAMQRGVTELGGGANGGGAGAVLKGITDSFVSAFSKVHKPDCGSSRCAGRRKSWTRTCPVSRRWWRGSRNGEGELESDYSDLTAQF